MGLGIFFLCVIFIIFVVTHMIQVDGEVEGMELASVMALIIFLGFVGYASLYFLSSLL